MRVLDCFSTWLAAVPGVTCVGGLIRAKQRFQQSEPGLQPGGASQPAWWIVASLPTSVRSVNETCPVAIRKGRQVVPVWSSCSALLCSVVVQMLRQRHVTLGQHLRAFSPRASFGSNLRSTAAPSSGSKYNKPSTVALLCSRFTHPHALAAPSLPTAFAPSVTHAKHVDDLHYYGTLRHPVGRGG
jgi:hypothetical protein